MSLLEREELRVALLTTRNSVLSVETVYVGNVSASVVRIAELFSEAIRRTAPSILLLHNHPSGDPTPSPDDLHLTAEAITAGQLLDIAVLDHIVIGGGSFISLRESGVAFLGKDGHAARDLAVEFVDERWHPCQCSHGRPQHTPLADAQPSHCTVPPCPCLGYTAATPAGEALGALRYGEAWVPVRPSPVAAAGPGQSPLAPAPTAAAVSTHRRYEGRDVYDAALDRLVRLYADGHRVVISISGGKDSTVCLGLAKTAARITGRLPVEAMHRDDEIMTPGTFEYLDRVFADPEVDLHHWYSREPCGYWFSRSLPFYWPFDVSLPPADWMRQPPAQAEEVAEPLPWYVNADRFPPARGKQLISVLGLRAEESPWRLRGIHSSGGYLTQPNRAGAIVARPIYDWRAEDVWRFIAIERPDYSRGYDVMKAAGVPPRRLRISSIGIVVSSVHDHPKLAQAFPDWSQKLVSRLGADVATIARLGPRAIRPEIRPGETWAETAQRECVDQAPAWISRRATEVVARARGEHSSHAGSNPLPDDRPCPECSAYGSYRVIAQRLFWGEPWHSPWLTDVSPEQFRPEKSGYLPTPGLTKLRP